MTRRPNILFIMCDDHAANAISAYGSGLNHTPGIDRIASGGMRLDHCYVTNSICTPSRAAILTGTYNHVNGVTTLATPLDNRLPNAARHLRKGGYQTAIIGKWHLGEGRAHEPSGFDHWSVLPGQGDYFDPLFIGPEGGRREGGYVTNIITDKCLDFLRSRDPGRPFFLMCHHKAPHRPFVPHPRHAALYAGDLPLPRTFDDDYAGLALGAKEARMRVKEDLSYEDLGLVQPEGGDEVGTPQEAGSLLRRVPDPGDVSTLRLIDKATGEAFTFATRRELHLFKYRRYIQRYLRTVAAIDESTGRLLDWLEEAGLAEDTLVIYTSDQGFFLGEHGWFDKRFMYEPSLRMPFLVRYPREIAPGSTAQGIATNVDFAPTFLDYAGLPIPSYMQGTSLRPLFAGAAGDGWQDVAYHRYWMHRDSSHNAFAHYGIRDARYKLVYWYNDALGQPGANGGGEPPEWELFDCERDPDETTNLANDPAHAGLLAAMIRRLDRKMAEIGDIPEH